MNIQHNISLRAYNTFGIDVTAESYAEVRSTEDIQAISAEQPSIAKRVLGGGSNVLLTQPVKGLLLHNKLKGIDMVREDEENVWLRVHAGEVWHELVMYAIASNLAGIENLALIPGTVGAAPMQNIGAYGVEAKETIESVSGWLWEEQTFATYSNEECRFGYRDSIFKHALKDKIFISSVIFKLNKNPMFHTSYGAITQELEKMNVTELSIKAIAEAVIAIRSSKLPDPRQIGNAGSFFKNPTIPIAQFELLQTAFPNIPSYPATDDMIKIPAGWLIEQSGWKGYKANGTGVHEKQALVLVNYGSATGNDVFNLSAEILASVKQRFGIELEREVQIW